MGARVDLWTWHVAQCQPASGGHQPISEDCVDLYCSCSDTVPVSRHPSCLTQAQLRSRTRAAGPSQTPGGQPGGGSANNFQCYSSSSSCFSRQRRSRCVRRGKTKGSPTWVCCSRENLQRRTPPLPYSQEHTRVCRYMCASVSTRVCERTHVWVYAHVCMSGARVSVCACTRI